MSERLSTIYFNPPFGGKCENCPTLQEALNARQSKHDIVNCIPPESMDQQATLTVNHFDLTSFKREDIAEVNGPCQVRSS